MTTEAKIGHGTLIGLHNGVTFQNIGEITSISLPALSRDAVDATHMESTNGWREFIGGLKDAGEVSLEMNFVASGPADDLIRAQFDSDTPSQCQITLPSTVSPQVGITFSAILTGYQVQAPVDDKMSATVTFKITGQPTYT